MSAMKNAAIVLCACGLLLGLYSVAVAQCVTACNWIFWEKSNTECKNYIDSDIGRAIRVTTAQGNGTRCYPETFLDYWIDCECEAACQFISSSEATAGSCNEMQMNHMIYCDCYSFTGA